jgi:hypothetical protein
MGAAIQSAKVRAFSGTHPAIHSAQMPVAITNAGMIHHTGPRITGSTAHRCHLPESN